MDLVTSEIKGYFKSPSPPDFLSVWTQARCENYTENIMTRSTPIINLWFLVQYQNQLWYNKQIVDGSNFESKCLCILSVQTKANENWQWPNLQPTRLHLHYMQRIASIAKVNGFITKTKLRFFTVIFSS
jgi:hypothetical protein